MKILLSSPRGFCAGVNMAIECVDQVLEMRGPPVYVYHEIVHNRHVVERFVDRGVVFVDAVEQVPEGATLVFSAHGVSPEVRRAASARGLAQIDATCPLVTKVHFEAIRYARRGYAIVLIGHRDHDEVIGTLGEAPDHIQVVASVADVEALEIPTDLQVAYLTQTTLSLDDALAIIAALRAKFPRIHNPRKEDICYATTNRQNAVKELTSECDLVLVVGSRNSSNSNRLVDIARNRNVPAYLIDDVSELDHDWLHGTRTVLLTAGASAPEDLVRGVIEQLTTRYSATVEERLIIEEDLFFEPPASLKRLTVI